MATKKYGLVNSFVLYLKQLIMKISKIIPLFVLAVFAAACSKKDDAKPAQPNLDKATLSLTVNNKAITAPSGMTTSKDESAQQATEWISSANEISTYLNYFTPPSNAIKSKTKLVASNGRVATNGDFIVYTWQDGSGNKIGYQKSETADSYVFEIFLMYSGQTEWLKYIHAEEKTDQSSGSLKVLDIFGLRGSDASAILVEYSWKDSNTIFTFSMTEYVFNSKVVLIIDENTNAGSVVYSEDGIKAYEMIWDTKGNGTWKEFDIDGVVIDSGTWTVL